MCYESLRIIGCQSAITVRPSRTFVKTGGNKAGLKSRHPVMNSLRGPQSRDPRLQTPKFTSQSHPFGVKRDHPRSTSRLFGAKMNDRKGDPRKRSRKGEPPSDRQRRPSAEASNLAAGSLMRTPSRMDCGFGNLSLFNSCNSRHRPVSPNCSRAMLA